MAPLPQKQLTITQGDVDYNENDNHDGYDHNYHDNL